jgi:polyhydroxybutyrate depolymerase
LAYELPEKIKGIGVVAANLSKVQAEKKAPKHPVSAIFINGTDDPIVPYNGGQVTVFRKNRGAILSVIESIGKWKEINHCSQKLNEFSFPNKNEKDKSTAIKNTWINPENPNIKVAAITVINGGHTWPGSKQNLPKWLVGNTNQDFNGCDEIWNFFKSIQ